MFWTGSPLFGDLVWLTIKLNIFLGWQKYWNKKIKESIPVSFRGANLPSADTLTMKQFCCMLISFPGYSHREHPHAFPLDHFSTRLTCRWWVNITEGVSMPGNDVKSILTAATPNINGWRNECKPVFLCDMDTIHCDDTLWLDCANCNPVLSTCDESNSLAASGRRGQQA